MSEGIDAGAEVVTPTPPETRITGLIAAALIIPALTSVALCFVTSFELALGVSLTLILVTSILVSIDAYQLGNIDRSGRQRAAPWLLFLGMCGFWIIFYPFAFFRRRDFVGPSLIIPAILVALMYVGIPIGRWMFMPVALPACDSREVAVLLEQIVRQSPAGPRLQSIDGYREVAFDREAGRRQGQAIAHLAGGDVPITYTVEWRNRAKGEFQVHIPPPELPACTSIEVRRVLEQAIRAGTLVAKAKSIDDCREISYDREADRRTCQCTVHTDSGDVVLKYTVGWRNRERGEFEVRLAEPALPACDSKEVVQVLEGVLRKGPGGDRVLTIENHREISYDKVADQRRAWCDVNTDHGDTTVHYIVEWLDRAKGMFAVRTVPRGLPECDSREVIQLIDKFVRNARGAPKFDSIDGHREVSYDSKAERRQGECVIHSKEGDVILGFVVEWNPKMKDHFQIRTTGHKPMQNGEGK